jgi:hypothetical protein
MEVMVWGRLLEQVLHNITVEVGVVHGELLVAFQLPVSVVKEEVGMVRILMVLVQPGLQIQGGGVGVRRMVEKEEMVVLE